MVESAPALVARSWGAKSVLGVLGMVVKTRIFELRDGNYKNLSELAQAMGISVSQLYRVRNETCRINQKFITGALRAFPQYKLDTLFFEEGFELINDRSQVLAEFKNGDPAVVYSHYGKGEAVIVGSFIGSAYHHFQNPNNAKFFTGLASWLGVSNPVDVSSSETDVLVEARILEGDSYAILFGFNRGEKRTMAQFALSLPEQDWGARDLEKDVDVPLAFKENRAFLEKGLEPQEVWVVLIGQK